MFRNFNLPTKNTKIERSNLSRLSENAKFKKSDVDIKGLMTREFAKIPILGQPVKI